MAKKRKLCTRREGREGVAYTYDDEPPSRVIAQHTHTRTHTSPVTLSPCHRVTVSPCHRVTAVVIHLIVFCLNVSVIIHPAGAGAPLHCTLQSASS